jgi:hypothetical protein
MADTPRKHVWLRTPPDYSSLVGKCRGILATLIDAYCGVIGSNISPLRNLLSGP